jgi:hypothetical protein
MTLSRGTRSGLLTGLPALVFIAALLISVQPALPVSAADVPVDLWVDVTRGSDANGGRTSSTAFRSIQAAARVATAGATIHIQPGVYRENIIPASDGMPSGPIVYKAEAGPGTVFLRGSVSASSLAWSRLESNDLGLPASVDPANIYYADLSSWGLKQPPRFLAIVDESGAIVSRWMPAREPDARIDAAWKETEFWWLANGGSEVAACDPSSDRDPQCDEPWRSFTQLTDTATDSTPIGIEPGNLTTLGDLTGATLVAMDAQHAHYVYRRLVVNSEPSEGRITVDENCDNDGGPGLGWGSKYYVENHPALLDQPGEWWFDSKTGHLYLWSPRGADPGGLGLEISRLDIGVDVTNRSYITLDGLNIELFNRQAYGIADQDPDSKAFGDVIRNSTLRYSNEGIVLYQYTNQRTPATYAIDDFTLEHSEVAYMDTSGLDSSFWWPNAPAVDQFDHSGVRNIRISSNNFHDLGFNSDARSAVGVRFFFPDRVRFEHNQVHDIAHAGAHFHLSLIDSPKEYGFSPEEIKLGNILVADNVFERTCLRASDCGALKFGGSNRPDTHVFRDVLITGNIFRDTIAWSYVAMLRDNAQVGNGNGLYIDYASGIHAYRNIAYNNSGAGFKLSCLWRDGVIVLDNNVAANNGVHGFKFTGQGRCDNHGGSVDTQVANNILVNNGNDAIQMETGDEATKFGALVIDHNLYYQNGWSRQTGEQASTDILLFQGSQERQLFHTLQEVRAQTPWETNGVEGDPAFLDYDLSDHDALDESWPNFELNGTGGNAVDRGTAALPGSLVGLLAAFEVPDTRLGSAFDIGRFETEPPLVTTTAQGAKSATPVCPSFALPLLIAPLVVLSRRRSAQSRPPRTPQSLEQSRISRRPLCAALSIAQRRSTASKGHGPQPAAWENKHDK